MRKESMKRGLLLTVVLGISLGLTPQARAAFEDVEVSPRARALGGAFAALRANEYSPFHNPASLAWVTVPMGAASYVRPFGDDFASQSVATGVMQLREDLGGVGVGIRRFGVDYRGEDLTGETTVSLAYGARLLKDLQSELAAGASLNIYSLDYGTSVTGLDPGSATAVGITFAAQAVVHERTTVGFYAINVNNPSIGDTDSEELRRRVGAGVSYAPYHGVQTVLDIVSELGQDIQFRGGTEFDVTDFLELRAGMRTAPNIFTAGFGVEHLGISIDYAFSTGGGVLDVTHQFGIGYAFSKGK